MLAKILLRNLDLGQLNTCPTDGVKDGRPPKKQAIILAVFLDPPLTTFKVFQLLKIEFSPF